MTKHRNIIAGLAAAAALLLTIASTSGGVIAPAAATSPTISQLTVTWRQNPPAWPTHRVDIEATYVTGIDGKPDYIDGISLSCSPTGSGPQGPYWGHGNNVNGQELKWGGQGTDGVLNAHWTAPFGGNIADCNNPTNSSTIGSGSVDNNHHPRIWYTFTTNYGSGQGNVTATISVDLWGASYCTAHIEDGPGYLAGGNGCIAIAVP